MGEREFEEMLARIMKQDFSAGTEKFREELLARCLAILSKEEARALDDDDLDMLSAAGPPAAVPPAGGPPGKDHHLRL